MRLYNRSAIFGACVGVGLIFGYFSSVLMFLAWIIAVFVAYPFGYNIIFMGRIRDIFYLALGILIGGMVPWHMYSEAFMFPDNLPYWIAKTLTLSGTSIIFVIAGLIGYAKANLDFKYPKISRAINFSLSFIVLTIFGWAIGWICSLMLIGYWVITPVLGIIVGITFYKDKVFKNSMMVMLGYIVAIYFYTTNPFFSAAALWLLFSISIIFGIEISKFRFKRSTKEPSIV